MRKVKPVAETEKCNIVCKTCSHWKPEQAELEYSKHDGICTNSRWKFNAIATGGDIKVLDRDNLSTKYMGVQRFESQSAAIPVGQKDKSRYCFVTEEDFGCIHYERKENK